jgi:hypothetical protein
VEFAETISADFIFCKIAKKPTIPAAARASGRTVRERRKDAQVDAIRLKVFILIPDKA